jgi:hypothetical protein
LLYPYLGQQFQLHQVAIAQEEATTGKDVKPFVMGHYMFWTCASLVPLLLAAAMRSHYHVLGGAFLLSCTIKGYLYGVLLPKKLKMVLHPIIICTAYSMGCCAIWGLITGSSFLQVLSQYMPSVCLSALSNSFVG